MRLKAEITGMPRHLYFFLLFCFAFTGLNAQDDPDTLLVDYNAALPGSQWQFSFVHLTDVHIGEGAPGDDYGTPGYYDNTSPADAGDPLIRLRKSVYWINDHIQDLNIHFVVITGDLSESAEMSELLRCKQVLDSLEVPYIPVMGNHDTWPLSQGIEESWPAGDSLMNAVFEDAFLSASQYFPHWDNGTRLNRVWHPDHSCYSWFQNFSFCLRQLPFHILQISTAGHTTWVYSTDRQPMRNCMIFREEAGPGCSKAFHPDRRATTT
jgi:3',5'-cyclic AMP phosphodiesterase CpdA